MSWASIGPCSAAPPDNIWPSESTNRCRKRNCPMRRCRCRLMATTWTGCSFIGIMSIKSVKGMARAALPECFITRNMQRWKTTRAVTGAELATTAWIETSRVRRQAYRVVTTASATRQYTQKPLTINFRGSALHISKLNRIMCGPTQLERG